MVEGFRIFGNCPHPPKKIKKGRIKKREKKVKGKRKKKTNEAWILAKKKKKEKKENSQEIHNLEFTEIKRVLVKECVNRKRKWIPRVKGVFIHINNGTYLKISWVQLFSQVVEGLGIFLKQLSIDLSAQCFCNLTLMGCLNSEKLTLHKTWSFPLKISSVSVTKSGFWSHLLKKSLMENFMLCAVWYSRIPEQKLIYPKIVQRENTFRVR